MASGVNAASLPGATVFGTTPASTPETVSFILRERNENILKVQAQLGIKNYLSVSQFASRYGQTRANISALTSYLAGFGIKTNVYAENVDVVATGTAGEFDSALSVAEKLYDVPQLPGSNGSACDRARNGIQVNVGSPLLPYRLANFVLAILGLTNYSLFADDVAKPTTKLLKPRGGSSNSCVATFGLPNGCHLPSDFASMYNLDHWTSRARSGPARPGHGHLAAVDTGAPESLRGIYCQGQPEPAARTWKRRRRARSLPIAGSGRVDDDWTLSSPAR